MLLERPLNSESPASAAQSALRARTLQIAVRDLNATLEARVQERSRALAASEEQSRAVFEGFPECMFLIRITPNGEFLSAMSNTTAERAVDNHGKPAEAFLPASYAGYVDEHFGKCVEGGVGLTFTFELRLPKLTGTFEATLMPLRNAAGSIDRLLAVFRDVTERNFLKSPCAKPRR